MSRIEHSEVNVGDFYLIAVQVERLVRKLVALLSRLLIS